MTIKNIIYAQPIFVPDEKRLERNINSVKSFGEYLKNNGADGLSLSITFGGWAKTDDLWNKIVDAIKTYINPNIQPIRMDKNYGKAHVVNNLVNSALQQNPKIEAILTADSDILFPLETTNMFARLIIAAQQVTVAKRQDWGLISLNQMGQNCHWKSCYDNQIKYMVTVYNQQYPELIVWPTVPSGIAGGCLFINKKYWVAVGGYKVFGVYAGDDAVLLSSCYHYGYSWQMSDTIAIIHPEESDAEYAAWKVKVCGRDTATGVKTDISSQIKESEDFWNNRK